MNEFFTGIAITLAVLSLVVIYIGYRWAASTFSTLKSNNAYLTGEVNKWAQTTADIKSELQAQVNAVDDKVAKLYFKLK